jgi:cytoskeletal protein CcmA (bactofilin family)
MQPGPSSQGSSRGPRAAIGPATTVRGEISAAEDLWIDGELEGSIEAAGHQVTINTGARVRAEVSARTVVVEGELRGNATAEQIVVVRAGGRMVGDIQAPRVGLEEGCQFRGNVDMNAGAGTRPGAVGEPRQQEAAKPPAASATAGEPAVPVGTVGSGG